MAQARKIKFEDSLQKLEDLVDRMEEGGLSLDDSLKAFEEGVRLSRECQKALADAEQKINVLMEKNGELLSEPMEPEELEDPENE